MVDFANVKFSNAALSAIQNKPADEPFDDFSSVEFSKEGQDVLSKSTDRRNKKLKSLAIEFGEGITFGLLGELKATLEAATTEASYYDAKDRYEVAREMFKKENPDLAGTAAAVEFFGALPTGIGLGASLAKKGVSLSKAGAIEGTVYGAASGDTFEERVLGGTIGGFSGLALGKLIDVAITPSSAGGLKTQSDELADAAEAIDDQGVLRAIEEAEDAAVYTEVDNPK